MQLEDGAVQDSFNLVDVKDQKLSEWEVQRVSGTAVRQKVF